MLKTILNPKQRIFVLSAVLVCVALVLTGFVASKKTLEVLVDGKNIKIETRSTNPKKILQEMGVHLSEHDGYALDTPKVRDGSKIEVIRAIPVTVINQGKRHVVNTGLATVAEVLKLMKVDYANKVVSVKLTDRPRVDLPIHVLGNNEKLNAVEETMEFAVREQADSHLEFGEKRVITPGVLGKKQVLYKETLTADGSVKREKLSEEVLAQPQEQIVAVGKKNMIETSRGSFRYRAVYDMQATAYTPYLDGSGSGITATGIPARRGVVAVDPQVIPLGSQVYIPGYGHAIAADTGGAIRGHKIDLCIDTYQEAISFGRRQVTVYLLDEY
ncbi:3D domain-containing protein [Succinispira mobilis]|uniref:3D domain-containing protein n=1 Tax=Succinispira mobilis TaxID=78120 RepID=UPI00035C9546|nr:3D domain-containing protein [Succinispira mobilis]